MIAKKNLRDAEKKAFVCTTTSKVIPLPVFASAVCFQVVPGRCNIVPDALVCQLGWHRVWDCATSVYVSKSVKPFPAGAPVKVLWRGLVNVYLELQVIHLRARVLRVEVGA